MDLLHGPTKEGGAKRGELLIKIAIELRYSDHVKSLYYDPYFWKRILQYNFNIIDDNQYLGLYCNINLHHPPGAELISSIDYCIFTAALNGNVTDVDYFLNKGGQKDLVFLAVGATGNVELMSRLSPDITMIMKAFVTALVLDNYPMIEYLLPKIDNIDRFVSNYGTVNSIKFLRTYIDKYKLIDLAVARGDIEFVKIILKEEFDYEPVDNNENLRKFIYYFLTITIY